MASVGSQRMLAVYIGVLCAGLVAILGSAAGSLSDFNHDLVAWAVLATLFGLTEYADLSFHDARGRWGLSASEAVLMPMLVALSLPQVVWGVTGAIAVVRLLRWRAGWAKGLFNVASYGIAAAAAAGTYSAINGGAGGLTVRMAAAATAGVLCFSLLTHVFVAAVMSVAGGARFGEALRAVGPAAGVNLAGNLILGMFFVAAFFGADWTVIMFPVPLVALFFGYRAVLRQSRERQRVEHLHAASRALAASSNFEDALSGFLIAMKEIVSSAESVAVLNVNHQWFISRVRGTVLLQKMEPLEAGPLFSLVELFRARTDALVVAQDDEDHRELLEQLDAASLVGIPLMNGSEYAGCLLALDRVGAEEFGDNDARLLEALGNELVLTLDSYRLFAQVAEERERFQQIFAGSKEGICLLDEEGVIRAWNPALARITGFEEEDVLGEKWSERVLVRDRHHRRVEGMDIIKVPPDEELELVTRQGPPRWVSIMSGEVQAEDTKSWVVLVRDITREHELEESKSDFLSTISHELRTPLTTIKGSLQVLSRPTASANSEIGKQMIEIMKRGSDRLERLVMNLLAVSQMEAGDVQVYPDEVALEELVRARIASILVDHPEVDVVADEDVVVRADRERLSQAVEHLLDNARKFGPESGPIRVEIVKENGFARLSITDEGPGIAKIDQERIFDRFVRLGNVLTRETQGPGVGLFIAKHSIEAMGGSIQVESEPNRGATFHVRVPLAHPMAAIEPASSA